jgi:hypothetical protein
MTICYNFHDALNCPLKKLKNFFLRNCPHEAVRTTGSFFVLSVNKTPWNSAVSGDAVFSPSLHSSIDVFCTDTDTLPKDNSDPLEVLQPQRSARICL